MKTTIDKAGRVVIPAPLRERAGLAPGTEVEVTLEDSGLRLERTAPPPHSSEWVAAWWPVQPRRPKAVPPSTSPHWLKRNATGGRRRVPGFKRPDCRAH